MVRLTWLVSAQKDLRDIYEFISLDSKRYAKIQIEKIVARAEILRIQKRAGKIVPEKGDENIREIIEGTYRIIYRIKSDTHIEILTVHHSARDLTRREF